MFKKNAMTLTGPRYLSPLFQQAAKRAHTVESEIRVVIAILAVLLARQSPRSTYPSTAVDRVWWHSVNAFGAC